MRTTLLPSCKAASDRESRSISFISASKMRRLEKLRMPPPSNCLDQSPISIRHLRLTYQDIAIRSLVGPCGHPWQKSTFLGFAWREQWASKTAKVAQFFQLHLEQRHGVKKERILTHLSGYSIFTFAFSNTLELVVVTPLATKDSLRSLGDYLSTSKTG